MPRQAMSPQKRGAITRKRNREKQLARLGELRQTGQPVEVMLSWPEHDAVMLMREIAELDVQLRAKRQQLAEVVADKTS